MLFSDNAKIAGRGAIFKQSSCRGAIVQKRLKTTGVEYRIIQKVLHSLKQISTEAMKMYWLLSHKGLVKNYEDIWSSNTVVQLSVLA